MGGVEIFNAAEAAWWFLLAVLAAGFGAGARGMTTRRQWALVTFLALFGVSDVVEVFTGAWWKPPALLLLKAVCLCGLAVTAWMIFGARWRKTQPNAPHDSPTPT